MIDFEVTMDPIEEAQAIGLLIEPARHTVLPDGEWLRWIKRWSERDDLFLYRHCEAETFVLAVWVIRGKVATELMTFDTYPDHHLEPLPSKEELELRLQPASMQIRQMKKDLQAMASARKQSRLEEAEARKEAARHLRRKGLGTEAMGVEGWRPFTADETSSEASLLKDAGKVIV